MEAALLSCFLNTVLTKLLSLVEDQYKLIHGMKSDMEFLERELRMILTVIGGRRTCGRDSIKPVQRISIQDLRKLAHKIEDCIDGLMYYAVREHKAPWTRRFLQFLRTQYNLRTHAEELKRLRSKATEQHDQSKRYEFYEDDDLESASGIATSSCRRQLPDADSDLEAPDAAPPVGIEAAVEELVEELAEEQDHGRPKEKKLKVISIVGFPGSGKTVLARALYNSDAGKKFGVRAWISAAQKGPHEVLMNILLKLTSTQTSPNNSISDDACQGIVDLVRKHLENNRYLIVIDDMKEDQWEKIERAFPRDDGLSSRIMMTTTLHPLAKAHGFSNVNVHVHKMGRLDKENSKELFVKNACLQTHANYGHQDSERILEKCDGQALAIVNVGRFLRKMGWPTGKKCNGVCRQFRRHLLESEDLKEMREKLINSYDSLPSHDPKACLMHFGMFPRAHPIRRKSLLRLWLAEGFVRAQPSCGALDLAEEHFDTLMDRSIIESIHIGNNTKVKTCRTYGMMHEFILVNSMSQGSITLLDNDSLQTKPDYVRRLSFYDSSATDDKKILDGDFTVVRSLSIYGEASQAILDFDKYKLLRVLDLEGCLAVIRVDCLRDVCNRLLLLKYLSLGRTVDKLPKEIEKLKLLETLDLRKSRVEILPIEAFLLPNLVHLLGEFRLPLKVKRKKEVLKFLMSGMSNMETLVGFTTDGNDVLAEIMRLMTKLNKVKILCQKSSRSGSFAKLKDAIQKFILDKQDGLNEPRSLSLKFLPDKEDKVETKDQECYEALLNSLTDDTDPCGQYLTSFKLQGQLTKLPQFVLSLHGLEELCLESTEFTAGLLEELCKLQKLKYLKLIAHHLGKFIINSQSLKRLLSLCLVLRCPTLPTIEQGAMEYLVSLMVICKGLEGPSGMRIQHLQSLTDITLHPGVLPKTKREWEMAAKQHPKRPKILLLRSDDALAIEPSDDTATSGSAESPSTSYSTASGAPALETETQMLLNRGEGSSSSARYGDVSATSLTEFHAASFGLETSKA